MKSPPSAVRDSARDAVAQKILADFPGPLKRVLFVCPPEIPEANFDLKVARAKRYPCFPPYGPAVLCNHLEQRGYATSLLDLNFFLLQSSQAPEGEFSYSLWKKELLARLESFAPDAVAVTCMFTMTHDPMLEVARCIKGYDRSILVVAGGVHPSNATELVLKSSDAVDFVHRYEGEESFPYMLDFANGKRPGDGLCQLATLIDGRCVSIDERVLPAEEALRLPPQYHDLPIERYDQVGQIGSYVFLRAGRPAATILGVKGCRAKCSFCSVRSFNGMGVRTRDVSAVVDELQSQAEKYGVKHFMWLDDDLFYDPVRTEALFNEIVRRDLDITWDATNGVIAAAITPETLAAAAESGCIGMTLGIESGSPEILRAVHKPGTLDNFRQAKQLLNRHPQIFVKGFLVIGFPRETVAQLLQTVNFAVELGLDWYTLQILQPLPSTEIYRTMIESGLLEDNMKTGNVTYYGGASGKERLREQREKLDAAEFFDLFGRRDPLSIPTKEELPDFWFLMDYKINYEKILSLENPIKIRQEALYLSDVCDRMTTANPTGHAVASLFLSILQQKMGDFAGAGVRLAAAERSLSESAYWQSRFKTLDLYNLMDRVRMRTSARER
ncbi:MAG: cobalamin B12-binding domain-containing protein [Elusimicrobia bacterium]|nr:cobalamin B12-binding domain-containing protein [Elusimicrobiota bacterium]